MDKQFLKENGLIEAQKQFARLCEWTYVPSNLEEDDDDEQQARPDDEAGNMGAQQQGAEAEPQDMVPQQGDNVPPQGEDPMGGDMPQGEGQMDGEMNPMGDDPMGGEMPQGEGQMDGEMNPMGDDPMGEGMPEEEDEDVIDVEDITNAQEKMNTKVNAVGKNMEGMDDKIKALMTGLDRMMNMINNNNSEIAKFKQEFEKRNPTPTEKLNLRSLDSYPFNVSPKDYWNGKGLDPNSNYSGYSNNDEPTDKEYKITNNDVDNFDERSIDSSFDVDDDLKQDILKIFGM